MNTNVIIKKQAFMVVVYASQKSEHEKRGLKHQRANAGDMRWKKIKSKK